LRGGLEYVLPVVDAEQGRGRAERISQVVEQGAAAGLAHFQRVGERVQNLRGVRKRLQGDKANGAGEVGLSERAILEGEAGLADAAGAGERDEARAGGEHGAQGA
jgi:hypothetical protein